MIRNPGVDNYKFFETIDKYLKTINSFIKKFNNNTKIMS